MKLARLSLARLPGIDRPFEVEEFGSGLNIIVGPNGIGKSRLCTAVQALLWSEHGVPGDRLSAHAEFDHDGTRWRVTRDGSRHAWQRDGIDALPPTLPDEHLRASFFLGLRDLLDDSDRASRDLAAEIRRQMSGGFDLAALERHFTNAVPVRIGQKEGKELSAAESGIQQAKRAQDEVERREREIGALESRAADAERAGRRLVHLDRAISLQALRSELRQCEAERAALPDALAHLDGHERTRLDRIDEDLLDKRNDRAAADRAREESCDAATRSGLTEPIDRTALATGRERVEGLAEIERQLDGARNDLRGARAAVDETRRALGARSSHPSEVDPGQALPIEADADLFAFARDSERLARERALVEEHLRLLAARRFSEDEALRLALLKRAIEPLRDWLSSPEPTPRSSAALWPPRGMLVVVGVACVLIGSALAAASLAGPYAIGLLGLGLGLSVAGLRMRLNRDDPGEGDARAIAQRKFPEAIDPPERWSREAVRARLHALEDEYARLEAHGKRAEIREVERAPLEERLRGLEAGEAALDVRRRELIERLGVEPMGSDAGWVDLARVLQDARRARVEWRRAEARVTELEELRTARLDSIAAFIESVGGAAPTDVASARATIHALEERDRMLRSALLDRAREEANLVRLDVEIGRLETERAAIFEKAGLDTHEPARLVRLLAQLAGFRELELRCAGLARDIGRERDALEAAGEADLIDRESVELEMERSRLEAVVEARDELNAELGAIRANARAAREGHALEDAIAKRDALRRALGERREQALEAAAGRFLIEGVRREHELNQMPRVLERTRTRFGLFTHHRYDLKVSPGEEASFVAVDAKSGEGLQPAQLSDGTRAQLILAARLAFAEEAEAGADLPLFLDEAMDHSDPERFHAIARSLARMVADEGRQIFYLSNDPTDVARFEQAFEKEGCDRIQIHDLEEIRGRATRTEGPAALRVAPLPSIPSAAGQTAEQYAVSIGVTRFDPRAGSSSQHVFHLLRDDLATLEGLLRLRIETVGQCENMLRSGDVRADEIRMGGEVARQLAARIGLLDDYCHAWLVGRGRAVGRAEIEASGSVTKNFLEAVVEIAEELEGDAADLISALREKSDPRLSGFRTKSTEGLESHFVKEGHLDDRPILGETDLLGRVMAAPSAKQLPAKVATELVHQWWTLSLPPARSDG